MRGSKNFWGRARVTNRRYGPQAEIKISEAFGSYDWFRDRDFLFSEYVEKQKSTAHIARELACARSTVSKYLLEHNIPIRPEAMPHYRKSQPALGERVVNGQMVPHKGELEIIG